ncbi:MAG: (5-formylfuran-3-yl)methyl phosphate synthase [Planctomycetota bacterium]
MSDRERPDAKPLLLVSLRDASEAEAVTHHVDIVDLKNTDEGALGAPRLDDVLAIAERISSPLSVALGDLPDLPGTAALAARAAASLGASYVKAGVHGPRTQERATALLSAIVRGVRSAGSAKVVAAGYADYREGGFLSPTDLVAAASAAECDVVMLDTLTKDGRGLFEHLEPEEIGNFLRDAESRGLKTALAGSLRLEDLPHLRELGPGIVGVRGAVCRDGDRSQALCPERLKLWAPLELSES